MFGINFSINTLIKSRFYADDANKQMIPGYKKVNFTFSKNLESSKYNFLIKLNIDNALADQFYDNIRTNAWGGRYFEPAYGRYFLLGIELWY